MPQKESGSQIEFLDFGAVPLARLVEVKEPPFARDRGPGENPFPQLTYLEEYVKQLQCKSVVVERQYIDRDYMEDHSAFYARSLRGYENFCRRIHFFKLPVADAQKSFRELVQTGATTKDLAARRTAYRNACAEFSRNSYLGFSVIKPLGGTPVGRTVLVPFEPGSADGFQYRFDCTREYQAHLLGVELTVRGLGFQQQDVGVSACATTALWSAVQKVRDFEDIGTATPAQITTLASQYALPFGRSMPSEEGLSVEQMCLATQALGVSPYLMRAPNFVTARGILYAATASGFASVLIMSNDADDKIYHAIAVAGMKVKAGHDKTLIEGKYADRAGDLAGLIIHDDRIGPYLETNVVNIEDTLLQLHLPVREDRDKKWNLRAILIPMHSRIRLSFDGLHYIATRLINSLGALQDAFAHVAAQNQSSFQPRIVFDTLIDRGYRYCERLVLGEAECDGAKLDNFFKRVRLARYVGVVRLATSNLGSFDVLADTTSTHANLNFLAVMVRGPITEFTKSAAELLAEECNCEIYFLCSDAEEASYI